MLYASARPTDAQLFPSHFASFDASSMITGYDIGCKHSLQLKNSCKLRLNILEICLDVLYRRLWRPDIACIHNVKLALLVTLLMS